MGKQFTEQNRPSKRTRRTTSESDEQSQEGSHLRKLRVRNKRVEYYQREFVEPKEELYEQPKPKVIDNNPNKEKKKRGRKPKNPQLQQSGLVPVTSNQQPLHIGQEPRNADVIIQPVHEEELGAKLSVQVQKPLQPLDDQKLSAKTWGPSGDAINGQDEPFIVSNTADTGEALLPLLTGCDDVIGQYFAL